MKTERRYWIHTEYTGLRHLPDEKSAVLAAEANPERIVFMETREITSWDQSIRDGGGSDV